MIDRPAFWTDAYRRRLATEVLEVGVDQGRPWAVLADTVLFPEGGGQPSDRGWLGAIPVVDIVRRQSRLVHFLEQPVALGPATVQVDWERRFDHMQQHTAQHLLTALAADRFGWPTTAFHLGGEASDVELDVPLLGEDELRALEDAGAAEIRAARRIEVLWSSADELADRGARCRGLPDGHRGEVRLIEIEGVDLAACSGAHLRSTAEIETLALLGIEPMRGGTRVFFVAGGRLRRRLSAHERRNAQLRRILGAPDSELPAVAGEKLDQLQAADREARRLEGTLAEALGRELAAREGDLVVQHFADLPARLLRRAAERFVEASASGCVFLTADDGSFVLADAAPEPRASELGPMVAAALGARGGGRGSIYQGCGAEAHRRDEAILLLRLSLGGPSSSNGPGRRRARSRGGADRS